MKTEFVAPTTGWHHIRAQIYTQLWMTYHRGGINRDDLARVFEHTGDDIRKLMLELIDAGIALPENREGMYQLSRYPDWDLHDQLFALEEHEQEEEILPRPETSDPGKIYS